MHTCMHTCMLTRTHTPKCSKKKKEKQSESERRLPGPSWMPVPKLRNMASPLGQQTGRIDFQLLAVASVPFRGLVQVQTVAWLVPAPHPLLPQAVLAPHNGTCLKIAAHVRARERQRLDPWGVEEGGRRSMWYPVILARITSGRYKSPSGPGGLKPQLTAGPHSLLSAHSFGPLQKLPWGSVMGSGSWC